MAEGDDLQTFRVCQNKFELETLLADLEEAGIPSTTASSAANFDISTIGSERTGQVAVRIRAGDFARANQFLREKIERELTEVPEDHYLHEFTDPELLEVLATAHEWNEFDVTCARVLLTERGVDLDEGVVEELHAKRLAVEREGRQASRLLVIFGFLCSIFAGVVIFVALGVVGFLIGWSLATMKSTDPEGRRYHTYNATSRLEGRILMVFAAFSTLAWALVILLGIYGTWVP